MDIHEYFSNLGKKGGKKKGLSKVRGTKEYYQRIGRLAAEAKKRKRASK